MKKKLVYILLIHVCIDAGPLKQTPQTYRSTEKHMPYLQTFHLSPKNSMLNKASTFKQKLGLKKKKIEYTLALRY